MSEPLEIIGWDKSPWHQEGRFVYRIITYQIKDGTVQYTVILDTRTGATCSCCQLNCDHTKLALADWKEYVKWESDMVAVWTHPRFRF